MENFKSYPNQRVVPPQQLLDADLPDENPFMGRFLRSFVFLFMILGVYLGKLYGTPSVVVQCLNDPIHNFLTNPNQEVISNRETAKFLQISSSWLMDFTFFSLFTYWFLYGKSCRLILATIMFYSIRAISQILVQFKFPEGYDWQYPGFPSYVVPYGNTSDFFFSGHCGFLNICALECFALGKKRMGIMIECFNVYMALVMLIFRVHYTIDITTGLIVSHYCFMNIEVWRETLDNFFKFWYDKTCGIWAMGKLEEKEQRSNLTKETI